MRKASDPFDWDWERISQPSLEPNFEKGFEPNFRGPEVRTNAKGGVAPPSAQKASSAVAVQAALEVSEPGDALELEAEHVAERVVRMDSRNATPPATSTGRRETVVAREMEEDEEEETATASPEVQRTCAECSAEDEEEERGGTVMQRDAAPASPAAPRTSGGFERALGAVQAGGGEPLPAPVRNFMEPRFGQSFEEVRVHRDSGASELAGSVHAKAFTLGSDLFFKEGHFEPSTEQGQKLIAHELTHVVQQREGMQSVARQVLQREAADADATEEARGVGGLIVDDEVDALTNGQIRKSQFLAQLRSAVCSAADRELVLVGRDTKGCPVIERWLGHYAGRAASQLERAILKFVPEARRARSALDYIPIVAERVAKGVRKWALTGQIPEDIPPELRAEIMRGGDIGTMLAGAMSSIGGAISSAVSAVGSAIGGAISAIGSLFFKAGPGGARAGADPAAIGKQLGTGRPLEGSTRSRMESALGSSLGDVRVHDDAHAAGLSRELGAHAFTVGEHVAFGAGNYRPGTPVGDALLAHELAHVVQQGGGPSVGENVDATSDAGVEEDADRAAAGAVASLYAPTQAPRERAPRVRSGFKLSRCASSPKEAATPAAPGKPAASGTKLFEASPTPGQPAAPLTEQETKRRVFGGGTGQPGDWHEQVKKADAASAVERAALVQDALRESGVRVVDHTSDIEAKIDISKLEPFVSASPVVNYVDDLEGVTALTGRTLTDVAGHTPLEGGKRPFVILTRNALSRLTVEGREPYNFFYPKVVLNHELDHVRAIGKTKLGGDAEELETWTNSFVRDFHRAYTHRQTNRTKPGAEEVGANCEIHRFLLWGPPLDYYARKGVTAEVRAAILNRFKQYYAATIAPSAANRAAFRYWIYVSLKNPPIKKDHHEFSTARLASELNTALKLGVSASEDAMDARIFPCAGAEKESFSRVVVDIPPDVK